VCCDADTGTDRPWRRYGAELRRAKIQRKVGSWRQWSSSFMSDIFQGQVRATRVCKVRY
jgi:hypothetical protein